MLLLQWYLNQMPGSYNWYIFLSKLGYKSYSQPTPEIIALIM